MSGDTVRIDHLRTAEEYRACEQLQLQVWGLPEMDVVPLHLLVTFQRSGGLVLGAFDGDDTMIGCLIGFLGRRAGEPRRPKHCSHMMGVLPAWRGRGVGYRLKLAQRDFALAQGLDLVTWTYDPLESLNAALNIGKLGAVCCTYVRDLYGSMNDGLNVGLRSDRFQVDWWIGSERVRGRITGDRPRVALDDLLDRGAVLLNPARPDSAGLLRPADAPNLPDAAMALVEIPAQIRGIKTADMDLARRWRAQTREIFEGCFAAGYAVTGFLSEERDGIRRSHYVVERDTEVI